MGGQDRLCKDPVAGEEGITLSEGKRITKGHRHSVRWRIGDPGEVGWWGTGVGFAVPRRDVLKNYRQLTFGQGYGFFSGNVWMWELDCEESWAPKNWCFWTAVLEKTLESPLDCKEIQPVHLKRDQSWVFIGRTDAEAETPVLWPPDAEVTHWKRPWCWEGLEAGGEGDDRRWDGWMASPTWWTWVWVNSGSW